MTLPAHPDALDEVDRATDQYARQSPGTAARFADAVDQAIDAIAASPRLYSPADDAPAGFETRQFLLPKFPFRVVYVIEPPDRVVIVAVAHTARRPGYWHRRLTP